MIAWLLFYLLSFQINLFYLDPTLSWLVRSFGLISVLLNRCSGVFLSSTLLPTPAFLTLIVPAFPQEVVQNIFDHVVAVSMIGENIKLIPFLLLLWSLPYVVIPGLNCVCQYFFQAITLIIYLWCFWKPFGMRLLCVWLVSSSSFSLPYMRVSLGFDCYPPAASFTAPFVCGCSSSSVWRYDVAFSNLWRTCLVIGCSSQSLVDLF